MQHLRNNKIRLLFFIILSFLVFFNVSKIDELIFNSFFRDFTAEYYYKEEFPLLEYYPPLNYDWAERKNFYIAHALGGTLSDQSNTLSAMSVSFSRGFNFFEIDIWLDEDNILRCHHGPEKPTKYKLGSCTYEQVVNFSANKEIFLIVDIKSDFSKTASFLVESSKRLGFKNFILQLYSPSDIVWFYNNFDQYNLLGPIFSSYKMLSSQKRINSFIEATTIKALAMHYSKLGNNYSSPSNYILIFPVNNCRQANLLRNTTNFVYVSNSLLESGTECVRY